MPKCPITRKSLPASDSGKWSTVPLSETRVRQAVNTWGRSPFDTGPMSYHSPGEYPWWPCRSTTTTLSNELHSALRQGRGYRFISHLGEGVEEALEDIFVYFIRPPFQVTICSRGHRLAVPWVLFQPYSVHGTRAALHSHRDALPTPPK